MTYTPSGNKLKTTPNDFNGQVSDGNRISIGKGSNIQTQDATASPVISPLTVNTTATLKVPQSAVAIVIVSTTNAVQVSEDSTQGEYFTLPAGMIWQFDCARQQDIYLKTGSSTTVNFYFVVV